MIVKLVIIIELSSVTVSFFGVKIQHSTVHCTVL